MLQLLSKHVCCGTLKTYENRQSSIVSLLCSCSNGHTRVSLGVSILPPTLHTPLHHYLGWNWVGFEGGTAIPQVESAGGKSLQAEGMPCSEA